LLSHLSRERWLDGSFNASNLSSGAEICCTKKSSLSVFVAGKILWIVALRREGEESRALRFLKRGVSVMPPALILAARPTGNATAQAASISVSTPMRPASDGLPERSRVATVL
jgi:hypothetical protein